jgi:hypothetical protein
MKGPGVGAEADLVDPMLVAFGIQSSADRCQGPERREQDARCKDCLPRNGSGIEAPNWFPAERARSKIQHLREQFA